MSTKQKSHRDHQKNSRFNITIIYGSVRTNRQGIKAARFMVNACKKRGWNTDLIDPVAYQLPLLDKMYKEYGNGTAPETLKKLAGILEKSDGFVIVSAEYNHSMPPALTNLMDHFLEEYFWRPSAIVTYSTGSFGGVRAAMQLRAFLGELGTITIPSIFAIPKVQDAFDESGNPNDEKYDARVKRFLDELAWYAHALKQGRENKMPY